MKMPFKCLCIIVLVTLLHANDVLSIRYEECDNEEYNAYIRSSESCQSYLVCRDDDSMKLSCPTGEYFDIDSQSCDAEENVFCPLDEEGLDDDNDENEEGDDEDDEADDENEDDNEAADENDTNANNDAETNPIDRRNGTMGNETTIFNPLVIAPIVKDVCPNIDNPNEIVMMQNNQSCSDYYLCYHGQAIQMHCTDSLHFNIKSGKCDYPEKAQCSLDRPNVLNCLPNMTALYPHPDKCNYFYYCIKGFLTIQHCPHYYGWDIEKRSCVRMSEAICHKTARRT